MSPWTGQIGAGQRRAYTESLRGTDFGGNSGAADRTYTLPTGAKDDGLIVAVDGTTKHLTAGYTISSGVLTIVDPLDDSSYIDVTYFKVN